MKTTTPTLILIALLGSTAVWFASSALSINHNNSAKVSNDKPTNNPTNELTDNAKQLGENIGNSIKEAITDFSINGVKEVGTAPPLVKSAREQIGVTVLYDPAYVKLDFPMGDVPIERGVCTDVIIRAYRKQGKDLQALVNADMKKAWSKYPKNWGLKRPDKNIDHRRVPNLRVFFTRHGKSLGVSDKASDYKAGDVVTWSVSGRPHTGIVSNKVKKDGTPLIIHNIGRGTQEEDILFAFKITGHYRY